MRYLVIFATLTLASCASYAERCQSYGFTPGTPEMAHCIQAESIQARQAMQQSVNQSIQSMPTHCSTVGYSTTCY